MRSMTRVLRQLQTAATDAELALARHMGMNPKDVSAMGHLTFSPAPMGPLELSGRLGITPGAGTELVDRLERAGHLERRRDEQDRRRVHLIPTDSALGEVREALDPLIAALDAVGERYTEDERAVILRFLDDARDAYASYSERTPS